MFSIYHIIYSVIFMKESENIFGAIIGITYFICVFIEIKSLKRNKINIFYKNNFFLVLITSFVFPLAVFVFSYGFHNLKDVILNNEKNIGLYGLFLTYILGALAYMIGYIRKRIYAFISPKNKLSFLGFSTIYDREK